MAIAPAWPAEPVNAAQPVMPLFKFCGRIAVLEGPVNSTLEIGLCSGQKEAAQIPSAQRINA
jgi:hypothetical protein